MIKILLILLFLLFPILLLPVKQVKADTEVPYPIQEISIEAKKADPRAIVLRDYFAQYNSPLINSAPDFIEAADLYNVDWKLVPAIAGVESTFGKVTPGGYNGWGWGVYGTQALYFNSWKDGIYTVTKGLKENYINRGLTNPYSINTSYATSPYWGGKVSYFMVEIDKFSKNYKLEAGTTVRKLNSDPQTAKDSAKLSSSASLALLP